MSEPLEVDLLLQELKKCGLGYTIGTYMGSWVQELMSVVFSWDELVCEKYIILQLYQFHMHSFLYCVPRLTSPKACFHVV